MSKRLSLMAMGLSVALLTGCGGSSDDPEDGGTVLIPTTTVEAEASILGTWSDGCQSREDGDWEIETIVFNANSTVDVSKKIYASNQCAEADFIDDSEDTLSYALGEKTVGADGLDAFEFDIIHPTEPTDYFMVRFDVDKLTFSDPDDVNDGSTPELRSDDFTSADAYTRVGAVTAGPIAITEEMLSGKTFYDLYEGDDSTCYGKMTALDGEINRREICDGGVDETFSVPYTLEEGKVKADTPDAYLFFTLNSEDTTAWYLTSEEDNNKDGTIDYTEATTWYLSKPASFPASL